MAASTGNPSPTASPSRPAPSAPSPSPSPTPTSSTPAWAKAASAAMPPMATASTNPSTPAAPGRTSASKTPTTSRRSHPPEESRHRLRRRARPPLGAQRGARRLPHHRRRQDLETGLHARAQSGRDRPHPRSHQSQHPLRRLLGGLPQALDARQRRSRQRPFKSTDGGDTWTDMTRAPGLPKGVLGTRRRHHLARESRPRLGHRRSRRRRRLPLRQRRQNLDQGQRGARSAPARLVLHPHLRRPEERRHHLRPSTSASSAPSMAAAPSTPGAHRPTATITTSGSRRTIPTA